MNYTIEPVYFVLPVISLLFVYLGIGNRSGVKLTLVTLFILIYSLSLNGSDFEGYGMLYRLTGEGEPLSSIHGEPGYYYLMKLSISLGFNYITFRSLLLSITSMVLFYSISRLSENFALSVFYVSSMFIIYTISAYRQYVVIAFSIYYIYQYGIGHRKYAILGLISLLLIHVTAILPLACILCHHIYKGNETEKQTIFIKTNYIKLISVSLILRVVMTGALSFGPIKGIIRNILTDHASPNPTLFSFGLVSRLLFVIAVAYMYHRASEIRPTTKLIFWYYFVSILIYLAVPLEFAMGRLMNNASILLAVLIPVLRYDQDKMEDQPGSIRVRRISSVIIITEIVALIVLTNQLLHQDGYTPYLNILRGDTPVEIEEIAESDETSEERQEDSEILE